MEAYINPSTANRMLETSFLDGPKSPPTADYEFYVNSNVITSSTSTNEAVISSPPVETSDSNNQKTRKEKSSGFVDQVTCLLVCPNSTFVVAVTLVVGIMLTPIILYYTSIPSEYVTLSSINLLDHENCLVDFEIQQINTLVILCQTELNQSEDLFSNCINNSMIIELSLVYNVANVLNNHQCTENALSFFCNATYTLCDDDSYPLVSEECVQVRDNHCAAEWRIVDNLINSSALDCNVFQNEADSVVPDLKCPDNFEIACNLLCLPSCDFTPYSSDNTIAFKVWSFFFLIASFIGGVITLIASFFNRDKMFQYPLVFVVYATVSLLFLTLIGVIPFIFGHGYLFCDNKNLLAAIEEPTTFCQVQGFLLEVGIAIFNLFWIFHVFHVFASLAFPFTTNKIFGSKSYILRIHMAEIIVIFILGFLPSVITLSTSGYHYTGSPANCYPKSSTVYFYTLLFPLALGSILGTCFLLGAFWILRKKHTVESATDKRSHRLLNFLFARFNTSEFKLWILFLYYWIAILVRLTSIAVSLRNADKIYKYLNDYTLCSLGGYRDECTVYDEQLQDEADVILVMSYISTILVLFVYFINFFFVISFADAKKILKKLITC